MSSVAQYPDSETEAFLQEIYPVSRETIDKLANLVSALNTWQTKTNLVAPNTLRDVWRRHIADSLQCLRIYPKAKSWIDIGSGGGFPGLVIAIVLSCEKPGNVSVEMIESIEKKCAFLRHANRSCSGIGKIICGRIEDELPKLKVPDVLTARALADLSLLLRLSEPALTKGAIGLFHKGREYLREVEISRGLWEFDLVEYSSKVEQDSVLLEIRNLKRKT